LAAGVSGILDQTDGFMTNVIRNEDDVYFRDDIAGRLQLRYTPLQNLEIRMSVNAETYEGGMDDVQPDSSLDRYETFIGDTAILSLDSHTEGLSVKYSGDWYNLDADFSAFNAEVNQTVDNDFSAVHSKTIDQMNTQSLYCGEFTFSSAKSKKLGLADWIAGIYVATDETRQKMSNNSFTPPVGTTVRDMTLTSFDFAAFGQASYKPIEKLAITAGIRFESDKKEVEQLSYRTSDTIAAVPLDTSKTFSTVLPKVGLDYTINNNMMAYTSFSMGFRSGGYNIYQPEIPKPAYDPEHLTCYEVGLKTDWMDERLRANFAAYYIDWQDMQVGQYRPSDSVLNKPYIVNAASAHSQGFELEVSFLPIKALRLDCGLGYIDAKYDDYETQIDPPPDGPPYDSVDASGNYIYDVPPMTYDIGVNYKLDLGVFAGVQVHGVSGKTYFKESNVIWQDSYILLDAQIGYTWKMLTLTLWGRNITDENYALRSVTYKPSPVIGAPPLVDVRRTGEPMTMGIRLGFDR